MYADICVGPDGLLYCAPCNASSVLVIDPCARTLGFIEGVGERGLKSNGICAGPDGLLYCAPYNARSVLVIDPCTQELSFIEGVGEGGRKYEGICAGPDGLLYCAPWDAPTVLVIDPWTRTLGFINLRAQEKLARSISVSALALMGDCIVAHAILLRCW